MCTLLLCCCCSYYDSRYTINKFTGKEKMLCIRVLLVACLCNFAAAYETNLHDSFEARHTRTKLRAATNTISSTMSTDERQQDSTPEAYTNCKKNIVRTKNMRKQHAHGIHGWTAAYVLL